ncbi:MAG: hypothetical protein LDLANPLL_00651 [Turneriella sp.]|nr:hypothetical protein [Turneriella sp.]
MRKLTLPIVVIASFAVLACSTSKIAIRKEALLKIKTIAIIPFTSTVADERVTRDSAETFRSSLLASGFQIVEREKLAKILKEKELAQTGLVDSKAIEASQLLGADATLLGEITSYQMKSEEVTVDDTPTPQPNASANNPQNPHAHHKKKVRRDTFEFQISVRLVSNVDGQTILTLQNEYPVYTFDESSGVMRPPNLEAYRVQVLSLMGKDLEKAIREAREK